MAKILLLILFITLITAGCDIRLGGGFGSTDIEYMDHIKKELTRAGIKYSEEKDKQTENGVMRSIRYSPKDNEKVAKLREKLDFLRSQSSIMRFDDEVALNHFTLLLEEYGYEYRLINKDGDTLVQWYRQNNEKKDQKMMLEHVEFMFNQKHGKSN